MHQEGVLILFINDNQAHCIQALQILDRNMPRALVHPLAIIIQPVHLHPLQQHSKTSVKGTRSGNRQS